MRVHTTRHQQRHQLRNPLHVCTYRHTYNNAVKDDTGLRCDPLEIIHMCYVRAKHSVNKKKCAGYCFTYPIKFIITEQSRANMVAEPNVAPWRSGTTHHAGSDRISWLVVYNVRGKFTTRVYGKAVQNASIECNGI